MTWVAYQLNKRRRGVHYFNTTFAFPEAFLHFLFNPPFFFPQRRYNTMQTEQQSFFCQYSLPHSSRCLFLCEQPHPPPLRVLCLLRIENKAALFFLLPALSARVVLCEVLRSDCVPFYSLRGLTHYVSTSPIPGRLGGTDSTPFLPQGVAGSLAVRFFSEISKINK